MHNLKLNLIKWAPCTNMQTSTSLIQVRATGIKRMHHWVIWVKLICACVTREPLGARFEFFKTHQTNVPAPLAQQLDCRLDDASRKSKFSQ